MIDLYERLAARIDELEAALVPDLHRRPWWQTYIEAGVAQLRAGRNGQGRETPLAYSLHVWTYAHPDIVWRALAEDRDILRRHTPDRVPYEIPREWACEACTVDDGTRYVRLVRWPCPDVESLARRLDVEVS